MPGFDGSGPRGEGPLTGGGRGFCIRPSRRPQGSRQAWPPLGMAPRRGRGRGGQW
ncbi:MAG: DUF5320 domain-containing protein [bacterium]